MRSAAYLLSCLLLCGLPGCAPSPSSQSNGPAASHGGTLISLPGGKGFVEIMTEESGGLGGGARQQRATQIVAYFYQNDGSTEMSPPPTDVTVKVGTADNSPVVSLSPSAKAGEPKKSAKFASQPGPFREGFQGQLSAKINGEPVEAKFLIR
jgi:hypothetical protein